MVARGLQHPFLRLIKCVLPGLGVCPPKATVTHSYRVWRASFSYLQRDMRARTKNSSCASFERDTALARLVIADPGTEMVEHDLVPLHKLERLSSTTGADATIAA